MSQAEPNYYAPYSDADWGIENVPKTWNMADADYSRFIKEEFYWSREELEPFTLFRLLHQFEANQCGVDSDGTAFIKAPLLVGVPLPGNSMLLMVVRKLNMQPSGPLRLNTNPKNRHQVALVTRTDMSLKAIPTHVPLMCFEVSVDSVVYHCRADINKWMVPQIHVGKEFDRHPVLEWTPIRNLVKLKNRGTTSEILPHLYWAEGPWEKSAPTQRLLYNNQHLKPKRVRSRSLPIPSLPLPSSAPDLEHLLNNALSSSSDSDEADVLPAAPKPVDLQLTNNPVEAQQSNVERSLIESCLTLVKELGQQQEILLNRLEAVELKLDFQDKQFEAKLDKYRAEFVASRVREVEWQASQHTRFAEQNQALEDISKANSQYQAIISGQITTILEGQDRLTRTLLSSQENMMEKILAPRVRRNKRHLRHRREKRIADASTLE